MKGLSPKGTVPGGKGLSPQGTVPSHRSQRGYLLITVVVALFLIATIAVLLTEGSAINTNTASTELEAARAGYVAQAGMQHAIWRTQNNACMGDVAIPDTPLGADNYSATISGADSGTAYVLSVDQDAWIRSDNPTNNEGTSSTNHIRQETGLVEQVLTRFDLTSLPANAQINSAVARFYLQAGKEHPEGPVTLHEITTDWGETTVTWESFAAAYRSAPVGMIPPEATGGIWVEVNLTGLVQAWVNGQPNHGILMQTAREGIHTEYSAREDGANAPQLTVVVGGGQASPVTITATSELDTGVQRKLEDKIALAYQPPATVVLQLGVDPGEDAMPDSFYSARNYGGANYVQVNDNGTDWQQYPLIRFDLGKLPHRAAVRSARLELHMRSINSSGTATIHQVTRSWVEGTKSGGGIADGASWFTYDGTNAWASAGGDFNPVVVDETVIDGTETWVSWDVAPLVQRWLAGDPNFGLMIRPANGLREAEFSSKEDSGVGVQPKLTIEYACQCGSACMAPQGSGNILMVGDDANAPSSGDLIIKSYFESWGYTVKLIADHANQNAYDADLAVHDVVFVSDSVDAVALGTKLSTSPIGIVSANGDVNNELGISTEKMSTVGHELDVIDTDHYITRVFPAGTLEFKTVDTELTATSGMKSPDAAVLATAKDLDALVALESGGVSTKGGTVNTRRVLVPVGDSDVSWNYLTNNGQLVVQRSIVWAMKADGRNIGNVMLVVVDPGKLTAGETDKKALIESFGFTVNLISESASQADFDAAFAANDVVYVPQEINSSNLGIKLVKATIGVVNEEGEQVDELGFANDKLFKSRSQIDVIDNAHYITEPFVPGLVTFSSSDQSVHMLSGGVAPGLTTLGESFNTGSLWQPSLAVIETGGELSGGGTAFGRRVEMPWGGGTFDINLLTDDGRTIMRRALEWGAGIAGATLPRVLLVVPDASSLGTQDTVKKSLIESWGNVVTLISASAAQADFDAAVAMSDVAYVSEEITSSELGTKLRDATIGVVIEEQAITDEFGISAGNTTFTEDSIDVTNITHHITSPFSLGAVVFAASPQDVGAPTGTPAPGLEVLALQPSSTNGMLDVIETGGALFDSGTAAGRRVKLPWGGNDFDISSLTADGQTIMRRAIEWGAGAGDAALGPIAHWKLDDGVGTTAIDSEGGHDGTLINGPVWVAGQIDDALHFDGMNDYVDVGTFDVSGSGLTMMGWFNADSLPATTDPRIISKASSTAEADAWWQLSILTTASNANIRLRTKAGGTTATLVDSGTNLTPGQWYFAVGTYDAATGQMKLYLDGAEVVSQLHPTGGTIDANGTVPVAIGANGSAEQFFDGVLDDVRVYNRALSAAEISDLFTVGGGGRAEYLDSFDNVAYTGSEGSADWSGDPWEELSESDGPTAGKLFVAADPVVAEPGSLRLVVDSRSTNLSRPVDLSGFSSAYLSFTYRRDGYPTPSDYFSVLVSENGSTWLELDRIYGIANDPVYSAAVYDISAYATASTEIQIATGGINNMQTLYVDNVRVASTPPAGCAGVFADEFNVRSYANSDGTLIWAGDWTEIKESNGPTSGDIQVRSEINDYQLRVRDDGYGLWRAADLSGATQATLSLDYKRKNLDSSSDYVTVDVSSDGGSNWTELDRFEGGGSDNLYQYRYYDITAHAGANTQIRFLGSSTLGGQDEVWFDDIEIVCTP